MGRTGTFITIDAMMERLKERDDLNIFEFVNEMRTRRKQMVQTVVSTFNGILIYCILAEKPTFGGLLCYGVPSTVF